MCSRQRTLWVLSIPKVILLAIGSSEDVVSDEVDKENSNGQGKAELDGIEHQITRLEAVREGEPAEIANRQHEAESVGSDVHLGENTGLCKAVNERSESGGRCHLIIERVDHVSGLEEEDEPHRVGHVGETAATRSLLTDHADVVEDPKDQTGADFVERFEVKGPE